MRLRLGGGRMRGAGGDVQARVRLPRNLPHTSSRAPCNGCNVFLTRDEDSIVIPRGYWRDTRFRNVKIMRAAELLDFLR